MDHLSPATTTSTITTNTPKVGVVVADTAQTNRNHAWLETQLQVIWETHFPDVAKLNTVVIKWGRVTRTRLGVITVRDGTMKNPLVSEIRLNSLLQDTTVPESVIWQTIAHELAHYTHGFCSPHPRKYSHPHKGNVIQKELAQRKLGDVHIEANRWLRKNWHAHVAQTVPRKRKVRRVYVRKPMSLLSHLGKIFTG